MEFTVQGRGLEVTPDIREYLAKRLRRLDRHLAQNATGVVEIARSATRQAGDRLVVQVTINNNGALLRTEQHAADPRPAIDAAVDVLDRQVERVKGRGSKRGRVSLVRTEEEPAEAAMEDAEDLGDLVKTKQFKVQPLTAEEALEQMELLDHDFYVFINTATGRLGVVYRRRDGDYGLLDPQAP